MRRNEIEQRFHDGMEQPSAQFNLHASINFLSKSAKVTILTSFSGFFSFKKYEFIIYF